MKTACRHIADTCKALRVLALGVLLLGLWTGCGGSTAPASTGSQADVPVPKLQAHYAELISLDTDPTQDPIWANADWHTLTRPINDDRNTPPPHLTRVAMLYDQRYLYIAVLCQDSDLYTDLRAKQQDSIEVWLDTATEENDRGTELLAIAATDSEKVSTTWYRSTVSIQPKSDGTPDFSRPLAIITDKQIPGLRVRVGRGEINGKNTWGVTYAIPLSSLPRPLQASPEGGTVWHVNVFRNDWQGSADSERTLVVSNLAPIYLNSQQVSAYRMAELTLLPSSSRSSSSPRGGLNKIATDRHRQAQTNGF